MRSATIEDVLKAQETGKLEKNVMYMAYGKLVHGKKIRFVLEAFLKRTLRMNDAILAETADGEIVDVSLREIRPVPKGPAQTPKKEKRRPTKGTKPEKKIPYQYGTELKKGDVVILRSGKRAVVQDRLSNDVFECKVGNDLWTVYKEGIKFIVIPYEEKQDVISHQERAFKEGMWVANDPYTDGAAAPVFTNGHVLRFVLRLNSDIVSGKNYYFAWSWQESPNCVIAYQKA